MKNVIVAVAAVLALSTSAFAAEPYARNEGVQAKSAKENAEMKAEIKNGASGAGHNGSDNASGGSGRSK